MRARPDAPPMSLNPPGPLTMTSLSSFLRAITWARLKGRSMLHSTSALARPRSASRRTTDLPAEASWTARLTATLDLPTPPLPEVTAITEARGRWRTRERRLEAWSRRVMRDLRRPRHAYEYVSMAPGNVEHSTSNVQH